MKTSIIIYLCTAWRWLCNLGYECKDERKDVFVDKHKRTDVVEDRKNFLKKIERLKPYMMEFYENSVIRT